MITITNGSAFYFCARVLCELYGDRNGLTTRHRKANTHCLGLIPAPVWYWLFMPCAFSGRSFYLPYGVVYNPGHFGVLVMIAPDKLPPILPFAVQTVAIPKVRSL